MARNHDDQNAVRQYLLRQLSEDEQRTIEQRLLAEDDLFEDLEITEDELIDEYLANELSEEERQTFERDFLASPERKQKLRFVQTLRRYASDAKQKKDLIEPDKVSPLRWWRQSFALSGSSTSLLALAAVVLIVVGLGFAVWRGFFYQSDVDKGLVALNAAYREQRPLEARITLFDYAPFVTTRGSGSNTVNVRELSRAELTLLEALNNNPTPAVHHALGKVYLAKNDFDRGIEQFEEALIADPNNAQIYADLGAALLEKGKIDTTGKGIENLARSQTVLGKALALDPNLREAIFNRALSRQYMKLPQQAAADWREYLKKDSTSPWAEEARRNLKKLEEQQTSRLRTESLRSGFSEAFQSRDLKKAGVLLSQSYSSTGNCIRDGLLDSYLELRFQNRDSEAGSKLQELVFVGQVEEGRSGDRFTSDLAHFYGSSARSRIEEMLKARSQLKQGHQSFSRSNLNQAIEEYTAAKDLFASLGNSSEELFAEYRIAHCLVVQPNIKKASLLLNGLISANESRHYKWLLSQCYYAAANLELNLSEYSKAIERSTQALELSQQVNDINGTLKNLIQLADKYQSLNESGKSLQLLQQCLQLISENSVEQMQVWGAYIALAFNCSSLNFPHAALAYQKEALLLAEDMKIPLILSRNYEYIGLTNRALGSFHEAIENTQKARDIGKTLAGEPNGVNMIAHSSLQLADIYRESGDPATALKTYDESLTLYDQLGFQYYSYAAHKGKLLSYLALNDDQATERELRTVLELFEKYRSKINEESNRNSFFALQQSVYDLAIDFEYRKKRDPRTAFEYSEQSRARSLRDMTLRGTRVLAERGGPDLKLESVPSSFTLEQLQTEMPERAQLVQYALLDNQLLIWVVNKNSISSESVEVDSKSLEKKVQEYVSRASRASEGNNADFQRAAKDLYSVLIQPVERALDPKKELWFVPDKDLNSIPFASLVSPDSGNYLIEKFRLGVTPSSSLFLSCSNSASQREFRKQETLLSVGDPKFDAARFGVLPNLPAAKKEAQIIADYYPANLVLVGGHATPLRVKSEFVKSDVVHLALHYVLDHKSSLLSQLVLAKEGAGAATANPISTGALPAYEIYRMKLPRTRLVVLSACETGWEQEYQGEGAINLARPFIAAGVPLVVASLWPVDSDATAELMISFHKHRKQDSSNTIEALRRAQLEMLGTPNSPYRAPYYWASFSTIGGYAQF